MGCSRETLNTTDRMRMAVTEAEEARAWRRRELAADTQRKDPVHSRVCVGGGGTQEAEKPPLCTRPGGLSL